MHYSLKHNTLNFLAFEMYFSGGKSCCILLYAPSICYFFKSLLFLWTARATNSQVATPMEWRAAKRKEGAAAAAAEAATTEAFFTTWDTVSWQAELGTKCQTQNIRAFRISFFDEIQINIL